MIVMIYNSEVNLNSSYWYISRTAPTTTCILKVETTPHDKGSQASQTKLEFLLQKCHTNKGQIQNQTFSFYLKVVHEIQNRFYEQIGKYRTSLSSVHAVMMTSQ